MSSSTSHRKPNKLTLTAPKEPEFETAQRVRPTTVKSSAELEEEMMAKIPKFKARPLNKKILEAPNLPTLPKSRPQLPEFKEFHLKTMGQGQSGMRKHLQSSPWNLLRSKALKNFEKKNLCGPSSRLRPFNKKIFESKGDLGMFCNTKKQVTVPEEFHFATDERIPPANLSLNSEPRNEKTIPRNTRPNPFHLYTQRKEELRKRGNCSLNFYRNRLKKRSQEFPKHPYPYTTDYPVIPPKPEPKHCTKPEPFQLES
ncbi:hypothetical protein HAX54_003900 [Datura stramonium]|uniref:TPX2 central domain-containing protein n=1 Tax=Datura stramonium TaxID=4076 RepID=A0ABS8T651_DATST|nr:hypothetical protein [Datura stramonium]